MKVVDITVFWNGAPCSLVAIFWTLVMDLVGSSKKLLFGYNITRHHVPKTVIVDFYFITSTAVPFGTWVQA
jgi:hypothetical protein